MRRGPKEETARATGVRMPYCTAQCKVHNRGGRIKGIFRTIGGGRRCKRSRRRSLGRTVRVGDQCDRSLRAEAWQRVVNHEGVA